MSDAPLTLASLDAKDWQRARMIHLPAKGAARPWICRGFPHHILSILPNSREARDFAADAEAMSGVSDIPNVTLLPELPLTSEDDMLTAQKAERGEAMSRWASLGGVLAATPGALMGPFAVGGSSLDLQIGSVLPRGEMIERLAAMGYERADIVWAPGQFTYRGGIIDVFDPKDHWPIRIELFDDDVETIRFFATDTQRSIKKLTSCSLRALSSMTSASLADMLPADAHVVIFEPMQVENAADSYEWMRANVMRDEEGTEEIGPAWSDIERSLRLFPRIRVSAAIDRAEITSDIASLPNFRGRRRDAEAHCSSLASRGAAVTAVTESAHLTKWAESLGFDVMSGTISEGFFDARAERAFIGDLEMSGVSLAKHASGRGAPVDWGDRLMPGQWVVHDDYGVAKYLGSEQIADKSGAQEYLVLEYAEERRLKIPVMHFHKISRYVPLPGEEPTADNLRGGKWKRMSARAREQAEAAAKFLLEVYAARELTPGRSFVGDAEQEAEFEAAFPYKETGDQLAAISEVTRDMERSVPMDRLLVGDVGFGKTEVALRAAARCVFDGAQVALMAPTTLLAQQHYETWSARFQDSGARVEVLSRFVSPARQKKIAADVEAGLVDVLIGTHRLLGSDVKFKDLGLVIVDEEHRFGVMHKERLKNIYPGVDVLMLSATPIPRSLHMSLSGLRDMSLLQTPPRDRMPVITAAGKWSEEMIKNAVMRERSRGGQIFYVHNRVTTIDREAMAVRRLFPKLNVAVAHGQMSENELRTAMEDFSSGKTDILVCTTIVESGLDIPRANTLIVSDSQDLGLAQMHQLRGRVGRREEQAYALFLYPGEVQLTRDACERLEAITSLGEFGAGYELAKRDLEIRGGGELIGTAQHGTLGRVGFQRYCDLLEEAIRKAKGEWRDRTEVEVGIPSAIPIEYLPQESLRVALYRRLLWVSSESALAELRAETEDRFGPLPRVLEFLFSVARVKATGPSFGVRRVTVARDETNVEIDPEGALANVRPPRGWVRVSGGFMGMGGLDPLSHFVRWAFDEADPGGAQPPRS